MDRVPCHPLPVIGLPFEFSWSPAVCASCLPHLPPSQAHLEQEGLGPRETVEPLCPFQSQFMYLHFLLVRTQNLWL